MFAFQFSSYWQNRISSMLARTIAAITYGLRGLAKFACIALASWLIYAVFQRSVVYGLTLLPIIVSVFFFSHLWLKNWLLLDRNAGLERDDDEAV
jgi:hypothetical protein